MNWLSKAGFSSLALTCAISALGQNATIRDVIVLGAGKSLEVEIVASEPIDPETMTITGPDRLVFDFPNSIPGNKLRNQLVNRGNLKGIRVGRYASNPPVTRVVLDLDSPQAFKLYPSGRTLIVKLTSATDQTASITPVAMSSVAPAPPAPPPPRLKVEYKSGKLRIWANKATLAEVLAEVRQRTGADISVPAGAGQEQIVTDLGPGPARDVMASFLNGSKFNFVMVGSDRDPAQLRSVVLTTRGTGPDNSVSYPAVTPQQTSYEPEPAMQPPPDMEQQVPDLPPTDNEGTPQPPPGGLTSPPPAEEPPQQ